MTKTRDPSPGETPAPRSTRRPRPYDVTLRQRKQAELRARIAEAATVVHARKGALATSYADIAAEAGVSVPTVYAHYPTLDALLEGCTGHVIARAPAMPVDAILSADSLEEAASRLADAMERQHLHLEPWATWREDRVLPVLAALAARRREQVAALAAQVLRKHLGPGSHREAAAAWDTALSFDAWHRLARGHALTRRATRRTILQWLLAAIPPRPSSPKTARTTARSTP
ncbi:MAG: TetR/AcrR family transcriptional regulator [Burkholderiales bacterium]